MRARGPPRAPEAEDAALSTASDTPTVPPPRSGNLSTALRRNIAALEERRAREAASATREERIVAERRAQLDLQINLLAEHEVSKLAGVVAAIAEHLGIGADPEIAEIRKDVAPEVVLDVLEAQQGPDA